MSTTIKGHFSCDNSYAVYQGDKNKVDTLLLQAGNTLASQIFQGEDVEFQAEANHYLYLIAWSDDSVYQGLIGTFSGSQVINTGDPRWKVLPTKSNKTTNQFPTKEEINNFIQLAADTDWVNPFVGSKNVVTGHPYQAVVSNIPSEANWTWHDSGKDSRAKYPDSPYVPFAGHNHDEFLIFRIPIIEMAPEMNSTTPNHGQEAKCCCNQPIIVTCCCKEEPKPVPEPPKEEKCCCCGTCIFEVRLQRWRYRSGKPGFMDGQAEIKFTCYVNGNMYNYPSTNGSWLALNKRKGDFPTGWRAADARVGIVEVRCDGRIGVDIMTEMTEVAKKEKGISFENGEPYGTSDVSTVYFECDQKPNPVSQYVRLEHAGNNSEDLEIEVEYRFSQISSCSCCGC